MLKIGKGLKKKKKSKKNKHKEDELFTEEELEQYRRDHAQKAEEESGPSVEVTEEKPAGKSEELEKFKLLTAGVDDILRKSQGDLDRIKKESFFQRKPTPSELKAQEEAERAKQTEGNWIGFEEGGKEHEQQEEHKEENQEESESEYEFEENDDIFDTTYVDAIESGEVKLAYVPDDDEVEVDEGPDPFDTTTAEEVLKKVDEEERKKKKQISLGSAVNVLTGRAERDKSVLGETGVVNADESGPQVNKPRKRPRKIQDFSLLGSFDDNGNQEAAVPASNSELLVESVSEKPKSLLDDDLNIDFELPEGDALITDVLIKQIQDKKAEAQAENKEEIPLEGETEGKDLEKDDLKSLVTEFEVTQEEAEVKKLEEEDEFDEFTVLAASSVANQKLEEELHQFEALEDDPFDTSAANAVLKEEPVDPFGNVEGGAPVLQTTDTVPPSAKWAFDAKQAEAEEDGPVEVDPFDTTFVESIQPGKCELKLLENEILGDIVSTTHKTDIHLEARILSRSNSDLDFNPRAGEEEAGKSVDNTCHSNVSIHVTDPSGFVETQRGSESEAGDLVSLSFKHRDLLGGSTTDLSQLGDHPLPPTTESPIEDFSKYSDPFDTSIVDQVAAPGKAELKFIEKELLDDLPVVVDDALSDNDFDPRGEESKAVHKEVCFDIPSPAGSDLLSSVAGEGVRPLTPYYPDAKALEPEESEPYDPFDTSYVTSLPGKEELKLIEKELESVEHSAPVFVPVHKKLGLEQEPGIPQPGIKHSLSDQDFNPRDEEPAVEPNILTTSVTPIRRYSDITGLSQKQPLQIDLKEQGKPDLLAVEEEIATKALTPAVEEDISSYVDPFDTSIAENIAPGKAELKVLENEFVVESTEIGSGIKKSYTDPDFNPRDEVAEREGSQIQQQPTGDILSLPEDSIVGAKPLTPVDFDEVVNDDIDPFDTSIATNLLPGKAELRILESELFGQ